MSGIEGKGHFRGEAAIIPDLAEAAVHSGQELFAGLQTDPVALHPVAAGEDGVGKGDVELPVLSADPDGDRLVGVSIFAQVGEQVVKDPTQMTQIDTQCAGQVIGAEAYTMRC